MSRIAPSTRKQRARMSCVTLGLQQVQRSCALDRLKTTMGVKFAVDVLDMVSDGPHDNYEFVGNLVGGEASGDEPEYLALTFAQGVNEPCCQRRRGDLSRRAKCGEQFVQVVGDNAACPDLTYTRQ